MDKISKKKNVYKIPEILDTEKNDEKSPLTIGIIDASGSMSTAWTRVQKNWNDIIKLYKNVRTITFSSKAELLPEKTTLSRKLENHGGASTNILNPFIILQNEFSEVVDREIIIIFVSDGFYFFLIF